MKWINSFYSKLALALIASFIVVGLLLLIWVQKLTQDYQDEVQQKLHRDLASLVIEENKQLKQGTIDQSALKQAFHSMMILGPSFEFYIITPEGNISTYSADPNKIKRDSIDLQPVQQFLEGNARLPILGDDPRSLFRQKIFTVAEIKDGDTLQGYLYIIIGGELYDGAADVLETSHIIHLGLWGLAFALLFGLLVVLLLFGLLTRPLRKLAFDMQHFQATGFTEEPPELSRWDANSNDEVHKLGTIFNELSATLQEQYQKIKDTDQLRRELISYVSHDLRTPLSSLIGYLETWQMKQKEMSPEQSEELIQVAIKNASHMKNLVEQLFELAYLDSDQISLEKEPVAIAELIYDVAQKMQGFANSQGVKLKVDVESRNLLAMANIERLERAITNLVENAIRHTNAGGEVLLELKKQDHQLLVSIADTGIGIPSSELEHIFDPHFRASNSRKGQAVGGLGLTITKRIIQLHGSHISVTSVEGEGTRFSFPIAMA